MPMTFTDERFTWRINLKDVVAVTGPISQGITLIWSLEHCGKRIVNNKKFGTAPQHSLLEPLVRIFHKKFQVSRY